MAFDPSVEQPIPLSEVPRLEWVRRLKRRDGSRLHQSTVFRWALHGLRGVRLEVIRCGGQTCTSEAALKRFFAGLANPTASTSATPAAADVGQKHQRAEAELAAAGI